MSKINLSSGGTFETNLYSKLIAKLSKLDFHA